MRKFKSAQTLVDVFENILKDNEVLTILVDGKIGIATEDIRGYTPTFYQYDGRYDEGKEVVLEANLTMKSKWRWTPKDVFKVVLSSMSRGMAGSSARG